MTLYATIIFKVGDEKPIDYQCTTWNAQEGQMVPYDLTSCSVFFSMWDSEFNAVLTHEPATIDIADSGWVHYEMSSLYTATCDMYRCRFEVEDDSGHTLTFPEYDFQDFLVIDDSYM